MILIAAALAAVTALPGWSLVWDDEFDKKGPPDSTKWSYELGYVRNHEAQFYTANRAENARVENGVLVIEARKDNWEGHPITSASLTTMDKTSWTYGRIEVRAKVPAGRGTWPAIWTLGANEAEVHWPNCGEIDIMEYVGFEPDKAHFTIHSTDPGGKVHTGNGSEIKLPDLARDFHVYAIEWSPEKIDWLFDGKVVKSYTKAKPGNIKWIFDKPQFLILNLAIGGAWGGQKGIDDAIFPARFEVDYVRVYKRDGKKEEQPAGAKPGVSGS